jgi:hypothetical protein
LDAEQFERAIDSAPSEAKRIAWFGALLARESGLGDRLVIVGGSAIEVYMTAEVYVSQDIDVVGDRVRIVPVLREWRFLEEEGRDRRTYWVKDGLGNVDLVGTTDRSGLPSRREPTPYGDVRISPVEYLIVRRLMRAGREHSEELFRQAEAMAAQYRRGLDWNYIRIHSKYEGVQPLYEQLRRQVGGLRR